METRIVIAYLMIMNIGGFFAMGMDKFKARTGRYRIPEKVLFALSLLGGSIGSWAGMYVFRHKTKHWYFVVGMPLILILQCALAVSIFFL